MKDLVRQLPFLFVSSRCSKCSQVWLPLSFHIGLTHLTFHTPVLNDPNYYAHRCLSHRLVIMVTTIFTKYTVVSYTVLVGLYVQLTCSLLKDVNQLYISTKQLRHTVFYCILTRMWTYNMILMFYDHEIHHRKLSVTLSGFIFHFCTITGYYMYSWYETHW